MWARLGGYVTGNPCPEPRGLGKKYFEVVDNLLVCKTCRSLSRWGGDKVVLANDDGLMVTIPSWMKHPHVCILSNLVEVERYAKNNWITTQLFNSWTALNGFDYQLGNSPVCMELWADLDVYIDRKVRSKRNTAIGEEVMNTLKGIQCVKVKKCTKRKSQHVQINWHKIKDKKDLSVLDKIWGFSSEADENKTNISAGQIIWHSRENVVFKKNFDQLSVILGISASNVTATAIAIHCLINKSVGRIIDFVNSRKLCCLDSVEYAAVFKQLSVALRRSAHWYDGNGATLEEVASCAGWELAIGRSRNVSDWEEEARKRTSQRMYLRVPGGLVKDEESNKAYCARLKPVLKRVLSPVVLGFTYNESFRDFIRNRQSWVSSGSTGGEKLMVDGELLRINKHVLFEQLTTEEMLAWLEEEPVTRAVGSEKMEAGKARAIYGTKPEDYAISAYVLKEIEPRMNVIPGIEAGLVGLDVLGSIVRRQKVASTQGTECSMFDYADFNYQHTLEAQSLVFEVLGDLFDEAGAHVDKVRCCRWLEKAFLNQWCRFPGRQDYIRIVQGMFSGCRGTNFINTSLNEAYFLLACDWVFENFGLYPIDLYHIHQGDDVWVTNMSRVWAIVLFKSMQDSGFDFQCSKQMFDVNRAEFLRVLYSNEGCIGYLARAVAALIVKPIQSTDISGPGERAQALNSQISILARRGADIEALEILWKAVVPYGARVSLPRGGFSIPVSVLKLHPNQGGLGLCPPGQYSSSNDSISALPNLVVRSRRLEEVIGTHMTDDWIGYISEQMGIVFDAPALAAMVHSSNVTDSLRPIDRLDCLRALEVELRLWKAKLKMPTVDCNRQLMSQFLSKDSCLPEMGRLIEYCLSGSQPKKTKTVKGPIASINLAISMCPFQNLSSAAVSLKGSWDSIVRACISMCRVESARIKAGEAFERCIARLGVPVTRFLLDGTNVGTGFMEFRWHPVLISWVHTQAMEQVTLDLLEDRVTSVVEAKVRVQDAFDNAIRVLNKYEGFVETSRY